MAIEDEEEDLTTYKVVVNHEEQYSIWPVDGNDQMGHLSGWDRQGGVLAILSCSRTESTLRASNTNESPFGMN